MYVHWSNWGFSQLFRVYKKPRLFTVRHRYLQTFEVNTLLLLVEVLPYCFQKTLISELFTFEGRTTALNIPGTH